MLEVGGDFALEHDKQLFVLLAGVLFAGEHQILDEEKDIFAWAVIFNLRVGLLHLEVVEALHQL